MRVKRFLTVILSAVFLLLPGCVPVADTPADELRQYHWSVLTASGCRASLGFDGLKAGLRIEKEDFLLDISGLYALTDDRLTVFDEATGESFCFCYKLYGDRTELSYEGGTLTLEKDGEK